MKFEQANLIKFFALLTAVPRWVGALLAAEGFEIPLEWLGVWVPLSALLAGGMAVTEAWAFSYIFTAWRNQTDKRANKLLGMALISAIIFIFVLAPYVAARVNEVTLGEQLGNPVALWLWAIAIAASTITIIIPVGYAQKDQKQKAREKAKKQAPAPALEPCWCGKQLSSNQARSAHSKKHKNELAGISSIPQALKHLADLYPGKTPIPADVRKLMKGNTRNENSAELQNQ